MTTISRRDGPTPVNGRLTSFALMERVAQYWDGGMDKGDLNTTAIPRLPKMVTDLDSAIIVLAHATIRFFKVERAVMKAGSMAEAKALIGNAGFTVKIKVGKVEKGSVLAGVLKLLRKVSGRQTR